VRQLQPLGPGAAQTPASFLLPEWKACIGSDGCTDCTTCLICLGILRILPCCSTRGPCKAPQAVCSSSPYPQSGYSVTAHSCLFHWSFDQCHHDGHDFHCNWPQSRLLPHFKGLQSLSGQPSYLVLCDEGVVFFTKHCTS